MISLYVISPEIDNTQSTISQEIDHTLENMDFKNVLQIGNTSENIRKNYMMLVKYDKFFGSAHFKFNLPAFWVFFFGVSSLIPVYDDRYVYRTSFVPISTNIDILDKIRIALHILLLPCIAFYLIQIPFKLKRFWIYFFLVFLVFFLLYYVLPRVFSVCEDIQHDYYFYFGLDMFPFPFVVLALYVTNIGLLLFFHYSNSDLVFFTLGFCLFCIIIFWIINYMKTFWTYPHNHLPNWLSLFFFDHMFDSHMHHDFINP